MLKKHLLILTFLFPLTSCQNHRIDNLSQLNTEQFSRIIESNFPKSKSIIIEETHGNDIYSCGNRIDIFSNGKILYSYGERGDDGSVNKFSYAESKTGEWRITESSESFFSLKQKIGSDHPRGVAFIEVTLSDGQTTRAAISLWSGSHKNGSIAFIDIWNRDRYMQEVRDAGGTYYNDCDAIHADQVVFPSDFLFLDILK